MLKYIGSKEGNTGISIYLNADYSVQSWPYKRIVNGQVIKTGNVIMGHPLTSKQDYHFGFKRITTSGVETVGGTLQFNNKGEPFSVVQPVR